MGGRLPTMFCDLLLKEGRLGIPLLNCRLPLSEMFWCRPSWSTDRELMVSRLF